MKYSLTFILIFISVMCYSQTVKDRNAQSLEDFYFIIADGANDSYNSKTGLLTRLYLGGKKRFSIPLHIEEVKSIYKLFNIYNFSDMPSKFEIDWASDELMTITDPHFYTSLKYCEQSTCMTVVLNLEDIYNPINDRAKAFDYKKLYKHIWEIIEQKEEFKAIPESDFLYL